MKKIATFNFADYYISMMYLLSKMGYEIMLTPKDIDNTLAIGAKYSPETVCLPFKIFLGNYIEELENGAEALFVFGRRSIRKGKRGGVCRVGFYKDLYNLILKDLGYIFEPFPFKFGKILWENLHSAGHSFFESCKIIKTFLLKLKLYEYIRDLSFKYRASYIHKNDADKAYEQLCIYLNLNNDLQYLNNFKRKIKEKFESYPRVKNSFNL